MDYDAADPRLYSAPAPPQQYHLGVHQQQQQPLTQTPQPYIPPYPYYPNPNPNPDPNPNPGNPVTSTAPADAGVYQPPGVDPYPPYPFAPHGGYERHHAMAYSYPPAAAAAPVAAPMASYYHGAGGGEVQYGVSPISYGDVSKDVGRRTTFEDLEIKKLKLIKEGATPNSVRVCTICNIVCNSDTVFNAHLSGEKHTHKALGRTCNGLVPPMAPATVKPGKFKKANSAMMKGLRRAAMVSQSVHCEVCKLDCNSQEVLNSHKMGKKHRKNLQKLQESITAKPVKAPTTTEVQGTPAANKGKAVAEQMKVTTPQAATVDLQIKKRKVLDSGTAADAVRECTICSVVCNSQTVFDSHIAGQKHAAMVQQQQQYAPTTYTC